MIENTRIKYRLMKLTKINYIFIIIKENKKTFILLTKGDNNMSQNLIYKTALVTGATSGIGKAITKKLHQMNMNVVAVARNQDKLDSLAFELNNDSTLLTIQADVSNKKEIEFVVKQAVTHFETVDVLVNNAGKMGSSRILDGSSSDWEDMIDINIKGLLYGVNSVIGNMVNNQKGHIVNICSDSGFEVIERLSVYCATKFSVRAISIGLEKELANTGVRVTNISPGMVETELSSKSPFEENRKKLEPKDIANAVSYAISQPNHVNVNEVTVRPT